MRLSTKFLVKQLRERLVRDAATAARSGQGARDVAQSSSEIAEKREDARSTIEFANLAHAEAKRVRGLQDAIQALDLTPTQTIFDERSPVGLGAIVEAASEDLAGFYSKTFVLLPAGAGTELTGPDGDGIISVVTPASPVGRAMMGKRVGDIAEATVRGEPTEWEILEVWS
ncbi:MAG: GreA/GreB family elongation factor [Myxococcota bacterium]